jgi:serine protease Do
VNSRGEVVGINTFIFTGSTMSQGSIGIGFAIPINHAKNIAEELKTKGNIDRSYFTGIQVQPLNQRIIRYLDISVKSGVIIIEIQKGSPAERAKLELADIILSVNGIQVKTAEDIKEIILNQDLRSGDELDIKIYRNNQEKTVTMKLGKVKMKSRYW